jgi:WD40 repeat protein
MRLLAHKSYREFRDAIPKEFTSTTGMDKGPRVADFREIVGEQARLYRRERMPRAGNKELRQKRWAKWLADVHFDEASWEEVKSIDDDTISDLKDKQPAIKFYIAVYYRLHACVEHPQYADRIDRVVFGNGLRENGNPVFISVPDGPQRLQVTFPRGIRLDHTYQFERPEFVATKQALLNNLTVSSSTVVAIHGPGGYGKTALAEELCLDDEVREAFSGGIYWLQFGMLYEGKSRQRSDFIREPEAIDRMLRLHYETPEISGRGMDSVQKFVANLPEGRLLLIADDIWTSSQSGWITNLPLNVSVLFTTRHTALTRGYACAIPITRLDAAASFRLLTDGMSEVTSNQRVRLLALCEGFRGWPLIIRLANGRFKRDQGRSPLESIIRVYEQLLHDQSIRGWDIEGTEDDRSVKRRNLVGYCLQAGIDALVSEQERDLLIALAVLPDDTDIPVSIISDYWDQVLTQEPSQSGFNSIQASALLTEFDDLSFLRTYTGVEGHVRLHDEVLAYLRTLHTPDQIQLRHKQMIKAIQRHCRSDDWHRLPTYHSYGWKHLLYHLESSGQIVHANELRVNFQWIKAKLLAVGFAELQRSYLSSSVSGVSEKVGRAITLSALVLESRPDALALQIYGRLAHETDEGLREILEDAKSDPSFLPRPLGPHLQPLGNEIVRFTGHQGRYSVTMAALDSKGMRALTASEDGTARLWDTQTGAQIGRSLQHEGEVCTAVFDPSDRRILTASKDQTARLWDVETGEQIGPPLLHERYLRSAIFDPNGRSILTLSGFDHAQLWNSQTYARVGLSISDIGWINSAKFDPSGSCVLIASDDGAVRFFDASTGEVSGQPLLHSARVFSADFSPDGRYILSACGDGAARLWDLSSRTVIGSPFQHSHIVTGAGFSSDGRYFFTYSFDGEVKLWNAENMRQVGATLSHRQHVDIAVFHYNGRHLFTHSGLDGLRIWDIGDKQPVGKRINMPYLVSSLSLHPGKMWMIAGLYRLAAIFDISSENTNSFPHRKTSTKVPEEREPQDRSDIDPTRRWAVEPFGKHAIKILDRRSSNGDFFVVDFDSDPTGFDWDGSKLIVGCGSNAFVFDLTSLDDWPQVAV